MGSLRFRLRLRGSLALLVLLAIACPPAWPAEAPPSAGAADAPRASGGNRPRARPKAPSSLPPRSLLLRLRYPEGESSAFRVVIEGKGVRVLGARGLVLPVTAAMEGILAQQVLRTYEDGSADVRVEAGLTRLRLNGQEQPTPPPYRVTLLVAVSGRVLAVRAEEGPAQAVGLDAATLLRIVGRLAFPERPVRVGEAWGEEPDVGAVERTYVRTTLVGLHREGGREMACLKQVFSIPGKRTVERAGGGHRVEVSARHAGDVTVRFDTEAGRALGASGTVDSVVTLRPEGGASTDLRLRLSLRTEELPEPQPTAKRATR